MKKDSFSVKNAYSCERKKDVVTLLGVVLFFFVILFELYLVLWVPVQLKSRKVLEKEVAKQEMINLADHLRATVGCIKTKTKTQDGELVLAKVVLDNMAVYIREQQDFLNREQIRDLNKTLMSYAELVQKWAEGKYLIKEEQLDYSNCMKLLRAKAGLDGEGSASKP